MDRLVKKSLVTPQSLLIEQTALSLATTFYEAGRSSGLTSKHKNHKAFARANVEKFIPKAVELLIEIMGKPGTPKETKDLIYDAIMERTNDKELSNNGIDIFKNPFEHTSDAVVKQKPIIVL